MILFCQNLVFVSPSSDRFGGHVTDLAAMSQIWLTCQIFSCCTTDLATVHRFGCNATDLSTLPQIYRLCDRFGHRATHLAPFHRFGPCAIDLAAVPQIWPPCHRFGRHAIDLAPVPYIWMLCHIFGCRAIDLAAMPHTWSLFHKTLTRHSENMAALQHLFLCSKWLVYHAWHFLMRPILNMLKITLLCQVH